MGFIKTATADVVNKEIGVNAWNEHRHSSKGVVTPDTGFTKNASGVSISDYSPDKYLLTHSTIIASVDVDEVEGAKTGQVKDNGLTINREYDDYYIKPECSQYVNRNGDSWERDLLLATYDSFVGAENYVEHVQIPDMSKGKVIDAVARDLGETVYIDILVATDRKHQGLISKIKSGEMDTLSMGCQISFSICSKCGNKAVDETDLCPCVKYQKGNKFIDKNGNTRVVAELCGHKDEPDSVKFIEASWVGNPAFQGAVMRNILDFEGNAEHKEPTKYEKSELEDRIEDAYKSSNDPTSTDWTDHFVRTAESSLDKSSFNGGGFDDDEEEDEDGSDEEENPLDVAVKEYKEVVREKAVNQLKDELKDKEKFEEDKNREDMPEGEMAPNDSMIHSSYKMFARRYSDMMNSESQMKKVFAVLKLMSNKKSFQTNKDKFNNTDIISAFYIYDRDGRDVEYPKEIYSCLQKVGGLKNYGSLKDFLKTCRSNLGRDINKREAIVLTKRAKYLK